VQPTISQGTILWAPFPRGGPDPRPAVALSAPRSDGKFSVIVCSTQVYDPDELVELPSVPITGHPRTKLKERTFAVANWIETLSLSDQFEIKGAVPSTTLKKILEKIRQYSRAARNQIND
jgi:hypothetical protein